ncbi:sensor histidine kinase [Simplicispira psychrophila]|uniref:sensor histidine kinase n=1 Tax=Simplicispira psychrophila TaxID=80882 RepID=UPI00068B871F|nr:ATP-binding protein [Simplicispira psychrophila]
MFRTRPPRFALASLAIWSALCLVSVANVWRCWVYNIPGLQYWAMAEIVLIAILGVLLWMHLPRALQWHMRNSVRPSAELQAERQRIARDLHDHVGSQLVGAMALLDSAVPAQAQALRALEQCLFDVRWVVDSMDSTGELLTERLARLRHRLQPVLERRGIQMAWSVDCTSDVRPPDGERAAHLMCIAQEVLSNVVQHSAATQVEVRMAHVPHEDAWYLEISDNGIGLSSAGTHVASGQGLVGMHKRAQMAGGHLHLLCPPQGGTCVRVVLPCTQETGLTLGSPSLNTLLGAYKA